MDAFSTGVQKANLSAIMDMEFTTLGGKKYKVEDLRVVQYHEGWRNPWGIGGKNCYMAGSNTFVTRGKNSTYLLCRASDAMGSDVQLSFATTSDDAAISYSSMTVGVVVNGNIGH